MPASEDPPTDRELILDTYIRHAVSRRDEDFWAWGVVNDIAGGPSADAAWELVVALVRRAPDEQLDYVAAGPLEDMVLKHGETLVDKIEHEAEVDERFRWALGCIWMQEGDLPADVEQRVLHASGGEIKPIPGPSLRRLLRPDS